MDWEKAIERNGLALLRIVGALLTLLVSARLEGSGLSVPRHIWRKVLLVLRPAEAATRRLIIIAARNLNSVPAALCRMAAGQASRFSGIIPGPVLLAPTFQLFDPLKCFPSCGESNGGQGPESDCGAAKPSRDETPINADTLFNRLRALSHALADLPRQANRLARFKSKRDAALKAGQPTRLSLTRPGLPPGWHERPKHEIDMVLRECQQLVRYLDDTS